MLVWARLPGLTPQRKKLLLQALDDPCDLLLRDSLDPHRLPLVSDDARLLLQWRRSPDTAAGEFESELNWLRRPGHFITAPGRPLYPKRLLQLHDPPMPLFARGRAEVLQHPAVAVVGSRHPSVAARGLAYRLSAELGRLGFAVVSGMALGIDAAAHRGALDNKAPTLAVTATGLDIVYPRENAGLEEAIAENGLLLSEYPLQTQPRKYHFPARNRLVAALAEGVLVVEARRGSGALHTAGTACELGTEVMVVPASPAGGRNAGGHQLIRDGALLVEDTAQIVQCLRPELLQLQDSQGSAPALDTSGLSDLQKRVLSLLGDAPVFEDILADQLRLPIAQISSLLVELELSGLARREAGGYVQGP